MTPKKKPKNPPEVRQYWREIQRKYRARKKAQSNIKKKKRRGYGGQRQARTSKAPGSTTHNGGEPKNG